VVLRGGRRGGSRGEGERSVALPLGERVYGKSTML
jgi:hypothetical protein